MHQKENTIQCPECGETINVAAVLHHQISEQLKRNSDNEQAEREQAYKAKESALEREKQAFQAEKNKSQELIEEKVKEKLKQEAVAQEAKLKAKLEKEQAEANASKDKELAEKSAKLVAAEKEKAELQRASRERDEQAASKDADYEKMLNEETHKNAEKIRKEEREKFELKEKELEKKLDDQKKLTQEMQQKQNQGSMQLQGEVQELAIEDYLRTTFPTDTIQEIKKGERGADCLQIVHTRARQNCGSIYYESKRAKSFQPAWIEKFKTDIREKKADLGILVTATRPPDMERFGLKSGVLICSFEEFKALCGVMREHIIQMSTALATQENKGDKMSQLYNFLTGKEFKGQIEAIVEGFTQMQEDLDKEKRSMHVMWGKREKQMEKVLLNTSKMHGSLKGIAGNAIEPVSLLELPEGDISDS